MNLKLIFSIIALVIAFVLTFFAPVPGWEGVIITLVTAIAGKMGITSWRETYDNFKSYFESKTIWGALVVVIPILALVILPLLGVVLPELVITGAIWLITAGGGLTLWGVFDALEKADPKDKLIVKDTTYPTDKADSKER